jgi:flagellar L-ring protein precursor FlgH
MRRLIFAALLLGATATSVGRADSLWERRDPRYAFLFQDNRARRIGDTVIVTISETTVANEQDQLTLNRTSSGSGSVTFFDASRTDSKGNTTGGASMQFQAPSYTTNTQFAGNAQNQVNRVFTDRMAVTVVDVMPNGNLVVEGYRSRIVAGEERMLRITGVVRPADIGVGNVIPSGAVANFRISYLGRGPATRTNKPGIIPRLQSVFRLF